MMPSESRKWFFLIIFIFTGVLAYLLKPILSPFLFAFILAYLGNPLVSRFQSGTLNRTLLVLVAFSVIFGSIILLMFFLMPILGAQIQNLVTNFPKGITWIRSALNTFLIKYSFTEIPALDKELIQSSLESNWSDIAPYLKNFLFKITSSGSFFISFFSYLVLVPVVTFYLLRDWDKLFSKLADVIPSKKQMIITQLVLEIDDILSEFLRGQLTLILILSAFYSLGLWYIGLELAVVVGLLAGVLSFVPYLGFIIGASASILAVIIQGGDTTLFTHVLIVLGLGQLLESVILAPVLVGERIGLHPLAVIFSVLAGGQLFGFFGVLLAVPLAAILVVLIRHWRRNFISSFSK